VKLEDIDKLNEYRKDWRIRKAQLDSVKYGAVHIVKFGDHTVNDEDILTAVRATVLPLLSKKLDEAKTRLMMLGVDEFPN
jgi:hypothetical protein